MESAETKGFVYEFGKFVLDPNEKTLFADGLPVHLPAKEFETLLLLVQNNGGALSKDEMMAAVWHDSFVEESNLAKQISKLRKIFNTNDEQFIETLPKHGYRFSADLRLIGSANQGPIILERQTIKRVTFALENEGEGDDGGRPLALRPKATSLGPAAIVGFLALLVIIGLAAFWYWNRETQLQPSEIKSIAVLPLRSLTAGEETDALGVGLTDSLITEIGYVCHLVVRPIASVRGFSNSGEDALELGRKLKVDAVLDGTIQQAGGRVRINARLISTATGEQIWAEKFDDSLTSLFEAQ